MSEQECPHREWTRYLRCEECGEPMTFANCGPFTADPDDAEESWDGGWA